MKVKNVRMDVYLKPDIKLMEEVVITGLGTQNDGGSMFSGLQRKVSGMWTTGDVPIRYFPTFSIVIHCQ